MYCRRIMNWYDSKNGWNSRLKNSLFGAIALECALLAQNKKSACERQSGSRQYLYVPPFEWRLTSYLIVNMTDWLIRICDSLSNVYAWEFSIVHPKTSSETFGKCHWKNKFVTLFCLPEFENVQTPVKDERVNKLNADKQLCIYPRSI